MNEKTNVAAEPKRLLMISTDRKILEAGSAVSLRQIAYAELWDEVHIIVFDTGAGKCARLSQKCFVCSTGSKSKWRYVFDAKKIGETIVRENKITEITCQDASLTANVGTYLAKKFGLPLEIQVHEDLGSPFYGFTWTNKVRRMMAKKNLPKADSIRVVSERIKRYLVGSLSIPETKITVRPIVVDRESIQSAQIKPDADLHKKYPQFDRIVLVASRLEREKNVSLAIKAWKKVIQSHPKAGLVIVGEGSEKMKL